MTHPNSAAAYASLAGVLPARQWAVFAFVIAHGPCTSGEVERDLGKDAHKRLPELRDLGLLRNPSTRACTVSGQKVQTWEITGKVIDASELGRVKKKPVPRSVFAKALGEALSGNLSPEARAALELLERRYA